MRKGLYLYDIDNQNSKKMTDLKKLNGDVARYHELLDELKTARKQQDELELTIRNLNAQITEIVEEIDDNIHNRNIENANEGGI